MNIVPCAGLCSLGRLSVDASKVLSTKGEHTFLSPATIAAGAVAVEDLAELYVIDGCEKSCATLCLELRELEATWSLTLSDLGIACRADGIYSEDDLILARDGIVAGCAEVCEKIPKNLGAYGCC